MKFVSPTRGKMELNEVLQDIRQYISVPNDEGYSLIVGTDSQRHGDHYVFVTSIIIHRIGKGARYWSHRTAVFKKTSLQERIYSEVAQSLDLAQKLNETDLVKKVDNFQVHIDVGKNGRTSELIKGVTGMVIGSGFEAYIKPYSYGASSVSDRLSK